MRICHACCVLFLFVVQNVVSAEEGVRGQRYERLSNRRFAG